MEPEWISYVVIGVGVVVGLWKAFGKVSALTATTKDDEFFAKVDPLVEQVVDVAESVTGKDLDSDGTIGKE